MRIAPSLAWAPLAQPMGRAVHLQVYGFRLGIGIVGADGLDKAAVTRRALVGHDDAIVGTLLGAHAAQTNANHCLFYSFNNQQLLAHKNAQPIVSQIVYRQGNSADQDWPKACPQHGPPSVAAAWVEECTEGCANHVTVRGCRPLSFLP